MRNIFFERSMDPRFRLLLALSKGLFQFCFHLANGLFGILRSWSFRIGPSQSLMCGYYVTRCSGMLECSVGQISLGFVKYNQICTRWGKFNILMSPIQKFHQKICFWSTPSQMSSLCQCGYFYIRTTVHKSQHLSLLFLLILFFWEQNRSQS